MPDNRCVECKESPCACDLEALCPHGVPRLFLGDCEPCSQAKHEAYLRSDGWCPASERDEAANECARLRNVIEKHADKLQGLGHEIPWKFGADLRAAANQSPTS